MKLSKATDYALVMLAHLDTEGRDKWISVRQVAEEVGISTQFLSNIVHKLGKAGLVEALRGPKGGVRLAKNANEITIGHVLIAMDDGLAVVDCLDRPGFCQIENHCNVRKFWSITHELMFAALKHISLKDIAMYLKTGSEHPKMKLKGELPHGHPLA